MGRSVVLAGAARCPRCSLPPRWCTCDMLPPVETAISVQVLIHRLEQCRPSSTGKLIGRAVANAACHVYQRGNRFFSATGYPADTLEPSQELWVLHPSGDPLPEPAAPGGAPPRRLMAAGRRDARKRERPRAMRLPLGRGHERAQPLLAARPGQA